MSKRTHALVLVAIVVAMNLPGMTAIAQAQLVRGARRRRRSQVVRGWWQLARWPQVAADQPGSRTLTSS